MCPSFTPLCRATSWFQSAGWQDRQAAKLVGSTENITATVDRRCENLQQSMSPSLDRAENFARERQQQQQREMSIELERMQRELELFTKDRSGSCCYRWPFAPWPLCCSIA